VLGCAEGLVSRQVARQLRITDQTVCKWRSRFAQSRLEGLVDEPRPGTPRKITDAKVEALITLTWLTQLGFSSPTLSDIQSLLAAADDNPLPEPAGKKSALFAGTGEAWPEVQENLYSLWCRQGLDWDPLALRPAINR
jgi:hypothetical protein